MKKLAGVYSIIVLSSSGGFKGGQLGAVAPPSTSLSKSGAFFWKLCATFEK